MTSSRPSADLPVSDTALRELNSLVETASGGEVLRGDHDDVRRIAAPVVAQFLRDLAAEHNQVSGGFLAELADEIDGGERDE